MRILQYKKGSRSARALSTALGCGRVNRENSQFRNNFNHTIINWGCSNYEGTFPINTIINPFDAVALASNKLKAFEKMKEAGVEGLPDFTTEEQLAQAWYLEGYKVVGRLSLTGHSGQGIVMTDKLDYPVSEGGMDVIKMREVHGMKPPLYVKYIKKSEEYRVHVINGEVVDVQQKRKRQSVDNDEVNYQVRNSSNGWVYCRSAVSISDTARSRAIAAVSALGLDFGAVDLIYNSHYDEYYVLEVNTACGMEGETVNTYATHLRRMVNGR